MKTITILIALFVLAAAPTVRAITSPYPPVISQQERADYAAIEQALLQRIYTNEAYASLFPGNSYFVQTLQGLQIALNILESQYLTGDEATDLSISAVNEQYFYISVLNTPMDLGPNVALGEIYDLDTRLY